MLNMIGLTRLAVLSTALAAAPQLATAGGQDLFPDTIAVPNAFQPEGIAVGPGVVYTGSLATGAIFRADLVTGKGSLLVQPHAGRVATGLLLDDRTDLLFAAGGPTGMAHVYDARTGADVASIQLTTATPTFINDEVIVGDTAFFTDSMRPVLYRVALGRNGRPSSNATVTEIPLGGDFTFVAGGAFNANGIVAIDGGRALIIDHSSLGALFRVDPRTGNATKVDLGATVLTACDGLRLRGDDLFVVQNQLDQVSVVELRRGGTRGTVEQVITDPRFDIPTGIDFFFGAAYVINARFGTPVTPDTTYTIDQIIPGRD